MSVLQIDWLVPGRLAACADPRTESGFGLLAGAGITFVVSLQEAPDDAALLARHGLRALHLPVRDFTPPTPAQLAAGIAAITEALAAGERVAVHCMGGLGRTGTLLACYLVSTGLTAPDAIRHVRAARPGSVETPAQEAAVRAYAREQGTREQGTGNSGCNPEALSIQSPVPCSLFPVPCSLYPGSMIWNVFLAAAALLVGAVITLANIGGGITFSFPLLLGVMLLVDGVLRLMSLPRREI